MILGKILRETDLKPFLGFVSPAFFDVMPSRSIASVARQLLRNYRDRERFSEALAQRRKTLSTVPLAVELDDSAGPDDSAGSARPPSRWAQPEHPGRFSEGVVELYFHQVYHPGPVLADLRASALVPIANGSGWRPAPVYAEWEPDFLEALRELYRGFYAGDDPAFRAALRALNLSAAESQFRHHFGAGQEAVRFRMSDFIATFQEVFLVCKDARATLPPGFIFLGVYLAAMYENLDRIEEGVDVRSRFDVVVGSESLKSATSAEAGDARADGG
ncbi:MAG: hypothetical protein AAGF12_07810 [Myxococcota bacterium]